MSSESLWEEWKNFRHFSTPVADVWNEKHENAAEKKSDAWKREGHLAMSVQEKTDKVWTENASKSSKHQWNANGHGAVETNRQK